MAQYIFLSDCYLAVTSTDQVDYAVVVLCLRAADDSTSSGSGLKCPTA